MEQQENNNKNLVIQPFNPQDPHSNSPDRSPNIFQRFHKD